MEAPVFLVMCAMWIYSDRRFEPVILTFFLFFQIHYFQRAFIFPLLLTGKSKMPLAIMSMGILFNLLNGYMQGEWIFYLAPRNDVSARMVYVSMVYCRYIVVFHRHAGKLAFGLCHPPLAQTGRYRALSAAKGMYRYVTSANYFGEIIEWAGWAILTCSLSGFVFLWWTIANLVPRAHALWCRYREEFGDAVGEKKRVFPFLY